MNKSCAIVVSLVFLLTGTVLAAAPLHGRTIDWRLWQSLPVRNGGRSKPLDTLARESLFLTSSSAVVIDSNTGRELNPTALYLTMLFEWSGWDHERRDCLLLSKDWPAEYSYLHQSDRWDKTSLLRVNDAGLKQIIGIPEQVKYIAPAVLATVSIIDPRTQQSIPFATWGRTLREFKAAGKTLTPVEEKGLELTHRLAAYEAERMGVEMEVVPNGKSGSDQWLSLGTLLLTKFDDSSDPRGYYRQAQRSLWQARSSFRSGDANKFNLASKEFQTALRKAAATQPSYPSQFKIGLEVAYNHWAPFRCAWMLMLLATVAMMLHLRSRWRSLYWCAIGAYAIGVTAMLVGFSMRAIIAGRPPVADMYESVIYLGLGVAVFGMVFETLYRTKYALVAAAAVSTIALALADCSPGILDPRMRPLEPILRSNFWLVTHVMTIALSYAAFSLALGIANITLGYYLFRSEKRDTIRALSEFTYKAIQVGVLLLAAGIVMGAIWADYSWGRFWGWDPKEVWALVALLGYLAVLHARLGGAVSDRGLAGLTVVCFSLVVMAWYGVNFVLGVGLHHFGFGGGGQGIVYSAIFLQWIYVASAIRRSRPDSHSARAPLAAQGTSCVA